MGFIQLPHPKCNLVYHFFLNALLYCILKMTAISTSVPIIVEMVYGVSSFKIAIVHRKDMGSV